MYNYTYRPMRIYMPTHRHILICIRICIRLYISLHILMYTHTNIFVIHTCCTYIHKYIHI